MVVLQGSMLGSGFIVYDDTACIVRNTWNFSRFITMSLAGNAHLVVKEQDG
jgi:NADH:ubiquinone oxidoreductase subunit F (NADH-binding)